MEPEKTQRSKDSLLEVLQDRQDRILSRLPRFARITFTIALSGFLLTLIFKLATDPGVRTDLSQRLFSGSAFANIITFVLGAFSTLVIWVFVIWSLSFVPFVAYCAFKASRESDLKLVRKPFRWVQLIAATFLPMAIFATAWESFATASQIPVVVPIQGMEDLLYVCIGSGAVFGILLVINRGIPLSLAALRFSLFSCLLYLSLFLSYGMGVNLTSHAMVFGILLYLMIHVEQIGELGRRIALHDVDPLIADKFDNIATRQQELRVMEDERLLSRKEHEALLAKEEVETEAAQAEAEVSLNRQLADVKRKKMSLNRKMNVVQLQILETKIDTLAGGFEILTGELRDRLGTQVPNRLEELRENVRNLSPIELHQKVNQVVVELNASLQGIPESLAELREQLLLTSTELEQQTRLLAEGSELEQMGKR